MQEKSKIHQNDNSMLRREIDGYLLETGDVLESTDLYDSSNGFWEPAPCPGIKIIAGLSVKWVRPSYVIESRVQESWSMLV